jgi:hypothetical protein
LAAAVSSGHTGMTAALAAGAALGIGVVLSEDLLLVVFLEVSVAAAS